MRIIPLHCNDNNNNDDDEDNDSKKEEAGREKCDKKVVPRKLVITHLTEANQYQYFMITEIIFIFIPLRFSTHVGVKR